MLETVVFPVLHCSACTRDVLAACDLDDHGNLVHVCSRCGSALLGAATPRMWGATALAGIGYDVEGEGEAKGCGTSGGGCGSCGSTCAA